MVERPTEGGAGDAARVEAASPSLITDWIKARATGFDALEANEVSAIKDFSLLWGFFEGEFLGERASARKIVETVGTLCSYPKLRLAAYRDAIAYFRARYFQNGRLTQDFEDLEFRDNDRRPLAEGLVKGTSRSDAESLSGLLIIIYRLRNNLFHGLKWRYGLRGQLQNFQHSSTVMMTVIDQHRSVSTALASFSSAPQVGRDA